MNGYDDPEILPYSTPQICPVGADPGQFEAVANGKTVPGEHLGRLVDSSALTDDGTTLRDRLSEDGYVYLAGALDKADAAAAWEETFSRLLDVGKIQAPASEGIVTGKSNHWEMAGDLGAFWSSVSEGKALRSVTHGWELKRLAELLLGEPAIGQDYLFCGQRLWEGQPAFTAMPLSSPA